MRFFLTGWSFVLVARKGITGTAVLGVPGDVGGLASGAELIEWAARVCVKDRGEEDELGERVLMNVMVTENGSPAK